MASRTSVTWQTYSSRLGRETLEFHSANFHSHPQKKIRSDVETRVNNLLHILVFKIESSLMCSMRLQVHFAGF